nr:ACD11 homolog protein-like isoform X1 [Ipomoea batatas]
MAFRFRSIISATPKLHSSKRVRATASGATISMEEEEAAAAAFEDAGPATPLSTVADAFERITAELNSKGFENVKLKPFCEACSLVSVLFGCLGIAFKFAEIEYVAKVQSLTEASKSYETLESILDYDVEHNSVKTAGSLSRNLRRVRQGLHLMKDIFQNFLSSWYVINLPAQLL